MAEASFTPAAPFDMGTRSFQTGLDRQQSMMERASRNRQNDQMEQMRAQEIERARVLMPVIRAKAQADISTANASIANNTQIEMLRQKAADVSPVANAEFLEAIQLSDWDQQETELAKLQAKYQWMNSLPEYKGFVDTLNNKRTDAFKAATIDRQMQASIEEHDRQREAAREVAQIRADASIENTKLRTATSAANAAARGAPMSPSMKKFGEQVGTKAADYYTGVQEKVSEHQRTLDTISSSRAILAKDPKQGLGEGAKTSVMQAFNTVTRTAGLPDLFDTTKREQLQRNYADMSLAAAARMKSQGQITEAERKLLQNTVVSFGNSPKAAQYIMDYMEAVANREIAKADYLREIVDTEGFVDQSREARFYQQNPISAYIPAGSVSEAKPIQIKSIKLISK